MKKKFISSIFSVLLIFFSAYLHAEKILNEKGLNIKQWDSCGEKAIKNSTKKTKEQNIPETGFTGAGGYGEWFTIKEECGGRPTDGTLSDEMKEVLGAICSDIEFDQLDNFHSALFYPYSPDSKLIQNARSFCNIIYADHKKLQAIQQPGNYSNNNPAILASKNINTNSERTLTSTSPLPTHYKSINNGKILLDFVDWHYQEFLKGFLGHNDCAPDEGPGYHWLILNLTITNISGSGLQNIAPLLAVSLIDTDNYTYNVSSHCVSGDDLKYANQLQAGGKTKLKIKFAIPKTSKPLRLMWNNYPTRAHNIIEFFDKQNSSDGLPEPNVPIVSDEANDNISLRPFEKKPLENRDGQKNNNMPSSKTSQVASKLTEIFDPQMLDVDLVFFEHITGPARKTIGNKKHYIIDNCYVTADVKDGSIQSLHLDLWSECTFDLNKYLAHYSGAFPPVHRMTFGEFSLITNGGDFFADCLIGCANMADPIVYEFWKGSHSDNNYLSVMLDVTLSNSDAIDAAGKWEDVMKKTHGEKWIENKLFNCTNEFNSYALDSFRDIVITGITIGYGIEPPLCPIEANAQMDRNRESINLPSKNAFIEKPTLYALIAGVSDYNDDSLDLMYPAKDARDFSEALRRQSGGIYENVNVRLLENPTYDEFTKGLKWLRDAVSVKDIAFLYISGHGSGDSTGDYYYLTKDSSTEDLLSTAVPYYLLKKTISMLPSKVLVFDDTAYELKKDNDTSGNPMAYPALDLPLAIPFLPTNIKIELPNIINILISAENGVIVFSSSNGKQTSVESSQVGNGAFTKALIEGFDGAADYSKDGIITINKLDLYVNERVKALTQNRQTPTTTKPSSINDFPIAINSNSF